MAYVFSGCAHPRSHDLHNSSLLSPPTAPTILILSRSEKQNVNAFIDGAGPTALRWFYQV
jgi:hypothetical protein